MDCQHNQKKTRIDEQESDVCCLNKAIFSCPVSGSEPICKLGSTESRGLGPSGERLYYAL